MEVPRFQSPDCTLRRVCVPCDNQEDAGETLLVCWQGVVNTLHLVRNAMHRPFGQWNITVSPFKLLVSCSVTFLVHLVGLVREKHTITLMIGRMQQ